MDRIQNSGPMDTESKERLPKHSTAHEPNEKLQTRSSLQHSARDLPAGSDTSLQVSSTGHDGVPLEPATSSPSSSDSIHDGASTSSLSVNVGSYTSASEASHSTIGSGDTSLSPAHGIAHFCDNDGGFAVHHGTPFSQNNNTHRPTGPNIHTSDFQLHIWLYETSSTKQTLAERLEQSKWEDDRSIEAPTAAHTNSLTSNPRGMNEAC
ncbi:hypothetical protein BKA65DRAFT_557805 [Rhexocercosporidium sp. MPI-PUGE-AT-0058]|nr:hypothetical protein BKA65DRAFT_557805 [Rhexocercosporidium sp. MPI-PUGE-AT-0058]